MKAQNLLFTLMFVLVTGFVRSQGVGINDAGVPPDASAVLDVTSTTKGFLPPRMTTTQRDAISSPAEGLVVFNLSTGCLNAYYSGGWRQSCFTCDYGTVTASSNSPVCDSATLNLSSTFIAGATYQWSGPNGFSSNQQNPSINVADLNAAGVYSLAVTKNGCTTNAQDISVTITSLPSPPVAGSNAVCQGDTLFLTASTISNAVYVWSGPNGFSSNDENPFIPNASSTNNGNYSVAALVSGCLSHTSTTNVAVNNGSGGSQVYTGIAADQSFVVGPCVHSISVKIWGAGGGGGNFNNQPGGGGGYTSATFEVTPGETLKVVVGEGGKTNNATTYGGGGAGAGPSGTYAGSGGGLSGIYRGTTPLAIAGGGGGGGNSDEGRNDGGGAGGGTVGQSDPSGQPWGAGGATQSGPGAGGLGSNGQPGSPGSGSNGGNGGESSSVAHSAGGGGGGGYYGGGGGGDYCCDAGGAGGGGSGYYTGTGQTLIGSGPTPANNSDTDRAGAGQGGATSGSNGNGGGGNGTDGRIVISW